MLEELEEFFSECIYFSNSSKINFLEYTLNLQAKEYIIPSSLDSDLENILICVEVGLHSLQTFLHILPLFQDWSDGDNSALIKKDRIR